MSTGSKESKLAAWIEERMMIPPDVARFKLYHVGPAEVEPITTAAVPKIGEGKLMSEAGKLAGLLIKKAKQHVETIDAESSQRYKVVAFSKGSAGKYERSDQFPFKLDTPNRIGHVVASEPATQAGFFSQMMRHIENRERQSAEMFGPAMAVMRETIGELREQNVSLSTKVLGFAQLREELESKKHIRDLEAIGAQGEQKRKDEMGKLITGYVVPEMARHVMPALLGKKKAEAPAPTVVSAAPEVSRPGDAKGELRRMVMGLSGGASKALFDGLSADDRTELYGRIMHGAGAFSELEETELRRMFVSLPKPATDIILESLTEADRERLFSIVMGGEQ